MCSQISKNWCANSIIHIKLSLKACLEICLGYINRDYYEQVEQAVSLFDSIRVKFCLELKFQNFQIGS